MSEVNSAPALHRPGQGDIVDQGMADRTDPTDTVQAVAANQHGTARRRSDARTRVVHLPEGVQHLEEIDKGGYQRALGKAAAIQAHHLADHRQLAGSQMRHQCREVTRVVHNISVGEENQRGIALGDALFEGP